MRRLIYAIFGVLIALCVGIYFLLPSLVLKVNRKISGIIAEKTRPKGLTVPVPSSQSSKVALPTQIVPSTKATLQPSIALPPSVNLTNIRHEYQTWNNCGPATTAMNLSFYKSALTQKDLAPSLKPDSEDKNVSPNEIVEYINSNTEYKAFYGINGNTTLVKQLLANNIPVMIETWFILHPDDEMGHYELTRGYDDSKKQFLMYDSYRGPNIATSYADYDTNWKVFDRTFIVIYQKSDETKVKKILEGYMDRDEMLANSLANAQTEIAADESDKFALFNLGNTLTMMKRYPEAAVAFDKARTLKLPWRMLWYQFPIFETYLAVGRNQDVIDLATANLAQANNLEESYYYRGQAYEKMDKKDAAKSDYEKALHYNKFFSPAKKALEALQ